MNSCIYHCRVNHVRMQPKKNLFSYGIFMAYIDLDELETLHKRLRLFSHNKWNVFSFFEKDHFTFLRPKTRNAEIISKEKIKYDVTQYNGKNTKEKIKTLIKELKLGFEPGKIFVLTNLRNYGYVFNPVSFYYCFDKKGAFKTLFSEVSNTYGDQKMYYVRIRDSSKKEFYDKQRKNFYISPFIDYNTDLYWRFRVPGEQLSMIIDSVKKDERVLRAVLVGKRVKMSNHSLCKAVFRYPFITFMIIFWIHFQALRLWLKKVTFLKKSSEDKKIVQVIKRKK